MQPFAATDAPATPCRHGARRALALGLLLAGVALLHAGLLHGAMAFAAVRPAPRAATPPRALAVRLLALSVPEPPQEVLAPALPVQAEPAVEPAARPAVLRRPPPRPALRPAAVLPWTARHGERAGDGGVLQAASITRTSLPVPEASPAPALLSEVSMAASSDDEPFPTQTVAAAVPKPAPAPAAAATAKALPARFDAAPATSGPSSGADVPVYRTRLPPAVTLAYELRRGALSGSGELTWQPQGDRYDLRLEGRVVGLRVLVLESRGTLDADGIAPVRYTDERRGRGSQAANFQRLVGGGGKITYSGPSTEIPLPRGAQDRVTWLVQLAAIAAADPTRVGPGGQLSMFVSGARADADVWTFAHVRTETLDVGGTPTPTLRLVREPRYAYDTRVDVWLDPARHFLPVRARLSNTAGGDAGEAFELMLRE